MGILVTPSNGITAISVPGEATTREEPLADLTSILQRPGSCLPAANFGYTTNCPCPVYRSGWRSKPPTPPGYNTSTDGDKVQAKPTPTCGVVYE